MIFSKKNYVKCKIDNYKNFLYNIYIKLKEIFFMRKPRGILGSMASKAKRRATNSATRAVYQLMWGENPKQQGAYNPVKERKKK